MLFENSCLHPSQAQCWLIPLQWNVTVCAGLDVAGFLGRLGLTVSGTSEKVGAVAIAYAAHKALSPVRFPPTVILTPVVAKILGKEAKPVEGTDTK